MLSQLKPGLLSLTTSVGAASCCIIPLGLITLGLGGGGLMIFLRPYSFILYPLGWVGLGLGVTFFIIRKRRCRKEKCPMMGGRINAVMLLFALVMMATSTYFSFFLEGQ